MKKSKLSMFAAMSLAATMILSSCIGSFQVSNNVLDWNRSVSNSKFVNELLFLGMNIIPVYPITLIADALVINSIEFWSGRNPVASNKIQEVKGENGDTYLVKRTRNGYKLYSSDKKENVKLNFDEQTQTWSIASNGKENKLFSFVNDSKIKLYLEDGSSFEVELNEEGVAAARQTMMEVLPIEFAALR